MYFRLLSTLTLSMALISSSLAEDNHAWIVDTNTSAVGCVPDSTDEKIKVRIAIAKARLALAEQQNVTVSGSTSLAQESTESGETNTLSSNITLSAKGSFDSTYKVLSTKRIGNEFCVKFGKES
ncbi:MAG: hypothetical protein GJ680_18460 [Alteromonadaceae bacterium]|nr:hypothetical protein [Alteromonadaceae bacterium]